MDLSVCIFVCVSNEAWTITVKPLLSNPTLNRGQDEAIAQAAQPSCVTPEISPLRLF